jgi:glutamate--cysteine ligase
VRDYVRWAFNVPMYFVQHVDAAGAKVYLPTEQPRMTFGAFFERGDRGRAATLADFELHMSTLFPDVRLKRYIELRGADCVPPPLLPALPALAKGLLYDVPSRKAALALLRDGDGIERRAELRQAACVDGLDGRVGELALRPLSIALLDLALAGIERLDSEFGVDPAARSSLHALEAIARGDVAPLWQQVDAKLRAQPSLRALIEPLSC